MPDSFDRVFSPPFIEVDGLRPIYIETVSTVVGHTRNLVALEAAGSNTPTIQDLGKSPSIIRVSGILVDGRGESFPDDNITAYAKIGLLERAMDEEREATFHHPTRGRFRVRISSVSGEDTNTRLGVVDVNIALTVIQERETIPRIAQSTRRVLRAEAEEMTETSRESFEKEYTPPSREDDLRKVSTGTTEVTNTVAGEDVTVGIEGQRSFSRLSSIYDSVERVNDQVVNVLNRPAQYARDFSLVYNNLQNVDSARGLAQALFRINEGLIGSDTIFGKYATRLGLGRLLDLITNNPLRQLFLDRPTAESFVGGIVEQAAKMRDRAQDDGEAEVTAALSSVIVRVVEFQKEEIPQLPEVEVINLRSPTHSVGLAYRYYGDTAQAEEIQEGGFHPALVMSLEVRV